MNSRLQPITRSDVSSIQVLRSWARQVAGLLQRAIAEPHFAATDEAANARDISITLLDRNGKPVKGRWAVSVWITPTQDGAPDATGNTVNVLTGTALATYTANGAYLLLTDETGLAEIRITIIGAATRYVYATAGGEALASDALTWT